MGGWRSLGFHEQKSLLEQWWWLFGVHLWSACLLKLRSWDDISSHKLTVQAIELCHWLRTYMQRHAHRRVHACVCVRACAYACGRACKHTRILVCAVCVVCACLCVRARARACVCASVCRHTCGHVLRHCAQACGLPAWRLQYTQMPDFAVFLTGTRYSCLSWTVWHLVQWR